MIFENFRPECVVLLKLINSKFPSRTEKGSYQLTVFRSSMGDDIYNTIDLFKKNAI